ncbi:MAG: PAS domain-containing protein [Anaeromyxobacter sp.]
MSPPSYELLRDTLERMTDAFVALDRDWRYVYVNARAGELFRRDPAALVGKHIWTEFPEGVGQPFHRHYERALATQQPVFFEDYYPPWDCWFENRVFPSPDGPGIFFSEVTERRRAEEALRESASRFRAVFDHGPLGIALRGPDGRIQDANPALQAFTGRSLEELRQAGLEAVAHPEDRPLIAAAGSAAAPRRVDLRCIRRDGRVAHASATLAAVLDEAGAPRFDVVILEDVSAQREAEEALRAAQRLEAVGRVAGGVAHDFNNLLAVILSCAELALDGLPQGHVARGDVEEILVAARKGAGLTRQLLAFGRRSVFEARVVDLNQAAAEVERMLRRLLPPGIGLFVLPAHGPVRVRVDPGQLQQAIINLAVNARDAMPAGGTLTLEVGRTLREREPFATLTVTDTGLGMDDATRARAFEPFFTTKAPGEGTGLGLAMVHGFAAQAGGAVELSSAPGQGTAVTVELPLVAAEQAEPGGEAAVPARSLAGIPVLVVEDEAAVRGSLVRILVRAGMQVTAARHGQDALLEWERKAGRFELLVTDLAMPAMGGRELLERLRALRPGLPALVISGYGREGVPAAEAETAFLEKPFESAALIQAVCGLLARARP